MSNRNQSFVSYLRRVGAKVESLSVGGGRPVSWITLQVILFFVASLLCACCSISSYLWGSQVSSFAEPTLAHTSRPTRTATGMPIPTVTVSERGGTGTSIPSATSTLPPTETLAPGETLSPPVSPRPPASATPPVPQSIIPTPTLEPEVTSTPTDTPTPGATTTSTPTMTSQPSGAPPDIRILHVEYRPVGSDVEGEHVLIENQGNDQDMTGWTLSNGQSNTYFFPQGFVLSADTSVRIWTKSGTNTETELYWGRDFAVWDDVKDSVYLRDNTGMVIDFLQWDASE